MLPQETDRAEEVLSALERTLRCGSALTEVRFEAALDGLGSEFRGVTRMLVAAAAFVFRRSKLTPTSSVGVIDFHANRCACYAGPNKVEIVVGDQRWNGTAGTSVDEISPEPASWIQPLWLLDAVRGVVDAREQGAERLDDRGARRFSTHADLNRAAEAVSYEMAVPAEVKQLADLAHVALEVWVDDDGHIARIRYGSATTGASMMWTVTLDLTEFGITLPSDWSRIPSWFVG